MDNGKRCIVCGGRDFAAVQFVFRVLDEAHRLGPFSLIIAGGAPGPDTFAVQWAESRGVDFVIEPADWEQDGRAAGPIRNQRMIDRHAPTCVIAFPGGRGTADMVRRANRARIPVLAVNGPFNEPAPEKANV